MATSNEPLMTTNAAAPELPRWRCEDPPEYVYALPKNNGNPLDDIYERMKQYDKGKCEAWRDEIEKLLIFAGLFSATVTAFALDSYKWLQPDNAAISAGTLAHISLQLTAIVNNDASVLSSTIPQTSFTPNSRSVRVNILWFASLTTCLSTVILGILCLQWLRQFTREISLPFEDVISIRQMRYEGLHKWKVPQLISSLPVILQTAVVLFFAGILELLWSLNHIVAAVITVAVGFVAVALVFTTVAPLIETLICIYRPGYTCMAQCPYKSPMSWSILRLCMFLDSLTRPLFRFWSSRPKLTSWTDVDIFYHRRCSTNFDGKYYNTKGLGRAVAWVIAKFSPELNQDVTSDVFHSLNSTLPRLAALQVLFDWARYTGNSCCEANLALELGENDPTSRQVQYGLLMSALLQRCSHTRDCSNLLMELRLRCLNTVSDKDTLGKLYNETAWNYYYSGKRLKATHLNDDNLHFQSLMAVLEYYRLEHNSRASPNSYPIGKALAHYIRQTQVKEDNAFTCYGILDQLNTLLHEIYQCSEERFASPTNAWDPGSLALFLLDLDLRTLEKWETDLERVVGVRVSVTPKLLPFMENILRPALLKHGHRSHHRYVTLQLQAFSEQQPYSYFSYAYRAMLDIANEERNQ